ncbi:hypothetical protein GJ496_010559 [Pomphorhynchus laevis]|nr:hypothetical protein GJ496_010559 [Pomphorhynchus laevis]
MILRLIFKIWSTVMTAIASNSNIDVQFDTFIAMCEKVYSVHKGVGSKNEKQRLLTCFVDDLRLVLSKGEQSLNNQVFYNVIRLLLSEADLERNTYSMQEARLAKALMKSLGISPQSEDARVLQEASKSNVDFSSIVFKQVRNRCSSNSSSKLITVSKINSWLDKLAQASLDNDRDIIMVDILSQMSALQIKWIIRILLKDLRLGLGQDSVVSCIGGEAALKQFRYNYSIKLLASIQHNYKDSELIWGCPFRPMLAERISDDIIEEMFNSNKEYLIQDKLDGERVQLHFSHDAVRYFSRSGLEYSEQYGQISETVKLLFQGKSTCIFDGEMMVFDKINETFTEKGASPVDVKLLGDTNPQFMKVFCIFDILQYNGKFLLNTTFRERSQLLEAEFNLNTEMNVSKCVRIVECWPKVIKSYEESLNALNVAVKDKKQEGIILKRTDSIYVPHGRTNCGWYKVKRDYLTDTCEDIDLLVVGYKSGWKSSGAKINTTNFFVACPLHEHSEQWIICSSINLGFTKRDLQLLLDNSSFPTLMLEQPPKWILNYKDCSANYLEHPSKGIVLQVRAAEIYIKSEEYKHYPYIVLRFARAVEIRKDKKADECNSVDDIVKMAKRTVIYKTKVKRKHESKLKRKHSATHVNDSHEVNNIDDYSKEHKLDLKPKHEVCLTAISTPSLFRKCKDRMQKLHENVLFVSQPSKCTDLILIEDENSIRAKSFAEAGYSIMDVQQWLLDTDETT